MNPYQILGVDTSATDDEIKRAYRALAKSNHPDLGGDQARMAQIATAYAILSDPEKRKRFDETGQTEAPPPIEGAIRQQFCMICEKLFFEREGVLDRYALKNYRQQAESQYRNEKAKADQRRKLMEAAKARIAKSPEIDPLGGMIASGLADLDRADQKAAQQMEIINRAFAMFDEYEITDPENAQYYGMGMFPMMATNTSGTSW